MRISKLAILPLLAALALPPRHASAQISVQLRLGRPIAVGSYSPQTYGDWRTTYRHWQPVTLYYYDGSYYSHQVRGGRAVMVYRSRNQYFLPPRDDAWNRYDHRYNYRRRPNDDDYNHAGPGTH